MGTALRAIAWGAGILALGTYFYLVARACGPDQLGAGRAGIPRADEQGTAVESAAGHTPSEPGTSLSSTASASSSPEYAWGFSDTPPGPGMPPPVASGQGVGSGPGGIYSQSFAFEMLETPQEAVLSTTLDLWSSETFQKLTLAEVRALLQPGGEGPAAQPASAPSPWADYDLTGDGLLLDRIGGLPTEEDVIDALDSPAVVDALQKFLVADGIWLEFELKKTTAPELHELLAQAERARDAAQDGLFSALDEHSTYRHWQLLGALWREMDRR